MRHTKSTNASGIRLYLLRHGQTEFNALDVIRGCLDVPLDKTGYQQAQNLAYMLHWQSLNRVVSGPLLRARQTAALIAEESGLEVEIDRAFMDRDYGRWTGWPRSRVNAMFGHVDNAPDIEDFSRFSDRVNRALMRIVETSNSGDSVALVGHKALNRAILAALFPYTFERAQSITQRTGCWNVCEFDGLHWTMGVIDGLPQEVPDVVGRMGWRPRPVRDGAELNGRGKSASAVDRVVSDADASREAGRRI